MCKRVRGRGLLCILIAENVELCGMAWYTVYIDVMLDKSLGVLKEYERI